MIKNIIKFSAIGLGIAILGVGALYGIDWLRYRKSPEYQAYKEVERIKQEIAQDPYGGDTAEQTLRLFIDALKKGDTNLASKYFVYEKQEEWKVDLAQIKDKGLLEEMVKDLERTKRSTNDDTQAFFTATNAENIVSVLINIRKNLTSGKWKIVDL